MLYEQINPRHFHTAHSGALSKFKATYSTSINIKPTPHKLTCSDVNNMDQEHEYDLDV